MKDATGELSTTVITIVAIAAVAAIFTIFVLPSLKDKLTNSIDTNTTTTQEGCEAAGGVWTAAGKCQAE